MHLVLIGECGGGTVVVSMTNISFSLCQDKVCMAQEKIFILNLMYVCP